MVHLVSARSYHENTDVNLSLFYMAITEQKIKITMIILGGDIKQKRGEEALEMQRKPKWNKFITLIGPNTCKVLHWHVTQVKNNKATLGTILSA